jgi:hypothetical protein
VRRPLSLPRMWDLCPWALAIYLYLWWRRNATVSVNLGQTNLKTRGPNSSERNQARHGIRISARNLNLAIDVL